MKRRVEEKGKRKKRTGYRERAGGSGKRKS